MSERLERIKRNPTTYIAVLAATAVAVAFASKNDVDRGVLQPQHVRPKYEQTSTDETSNQIDKMFRATVIDISTRMLADKRSRFETSENMLGPAVLDLDIHKGKGAEGPKVTYELRAFMGSTQGRPDPKKTFRLSVAKYEGELHLVSHDFFASDEDPRHIWIGRSSAPTGPASEIVTTSTHHLTQNSPYAVPYQGALEIANTMSDGARLLASEVLGNDPPLTN